MSSGLVLGRRPLDAILHSSNEPGELSQWLCHDDSTINIVLELLSLLLCDTQGALSSDSVLAGALWRNIFEMNCADVSHLELMVDYTRRQVLNLWLLSNLNVSTGTVVWILSQKIYCFHYHACIDSIARLYVFSSVCLSVCLFVCRFDNCWTVWNIVMKVLWD